MKPEMEGQLGFTQPSPQRRDWRASFHPPYSTCRSEYLAEEQGDLEVGNGTSSSRLLSLPSANNSVNRSSSSSSSSSSTRTSSSRSSSSEPVLLPVHHQETQWGTPSSGISILPFVSTHQSEPARAVAAAGETNCCRSSEFSHVPLTDSAAAAEEKAAIAAAEVKQKVFSGRRDPFFTVVAAGTEGGHKTVYREITGRARAEKEATEKERDAWFHVDMNNLQANPPSDRISSNLSVYVAKCFKHTHPFSLESILASPTISVLPPPTDQHKDKKLSIAIDLDETLIHCTLQRLPYPPAFCFHLTDHRGGGVPVLRRVSRALWYRLRQRKNAYVYIRPYAQQMLAAAAAFAELFLFTASTSAYADQVLSHLDPRRRLISRCLYREHCSLVSGVYTKDLRRLGRPNASVLVDNNILSFLLQPDRGIPVRTWRGEPTDREMLGLIKVLQELNQADDVPAFLRSRYGMKEYINSLRARIPKL